MVLYYFPPLGGAGVQRCLRFIKNLPALGWQPIVLTVQDAQYWCKDEALSSKAPEELLVVRAGLNDPWEKYQWMERIGLFKKWARKKKKYVHFPDSSIGWLPEALDRGLEILEKEKPDLLFTSSAPYTNHLIGLELKKTSGLPWIADFRDEWSLNPYFKLDDKLLKKHREAEQRVLKSADRALTVSAVWAKQFIDLAGRGDDFVNELSNGYDENDFPGQPTTEPSSQFTIVYTGAFYGLRQPDAFLEAIGQLADEYPEIKDNLKLLFAGRINAKHKNRFPYPEMMNILDYQPHEKSIALLSSADLLLLIIPAQNSDGCLTGKIYEYLASGRHILAIIPPNGEAAKVLRRAQAGVIVEPEDIEAIKKAVFELYTRWKNGENYHHRAWPEVEKYSGSELTQKLADLFNDVVKTAPKQN